MISIPATLGPSDMSRFDTIDRVGGGEEGGGFHSQCFIVGSWRQDSLC